MAALFIKALRRKKKGSLCLKASERAERTDVRAEIGKVVGNWHSWRVSS